MKSKIKDRVQLLNPRLERYVKFDTKNGGVVGVKKSKGPYKNVEIYRKKKEPEKEVG